MFVCKSVDNKTYCGNVLNWIIFRNCEPGIYGCKGIAIMHNTLSQLILIEESN